MAKFIYFGLCTFFIIRVLSVGPFDLAPTINKALDNKIFTQIASCRNSKLRPENIHVFIISTPVFHINGRFQRESVQIYAALYGYKFRIVDPEPIIRKYGKPDVNVNRIVNAKALTMLYYFKETFQTHGCDARWILFLDADVMVTNFARTLETIIFYANSLFVTKRNDNSSRLVVDSNCHTIGQFGETTINTGVLFFQVTVTSEKILSDWASITSYHASHGIHWQHDQGRFQAVYLHYLRMQLNITMRFNCEYPKYDDRLYNPHKLHINTFRNLCFSKNLYLQGLFPAVRNTGAFCILSPLTNEAIFNLHDFRASNEETKFHKTLEYVFIPALPNSGGGGNNNNYRNTFATTTLHSNASSADLLALGSLTVKYRKCRIFNPLFLHTKDEQVLSSMNTTWNIFMNILIAALNHTNQNIGSTLMDADNFNKLTAQITTRNRKDIVSYIKSSNMSILGFNCQQKNEEPTGLTQEESNYVNYYQAPRKDSIKESITTITTTSCSKHMLLLQQQQAASEYWMGSIWRNQVSALNSHHGLS